MITGHPWITIYGKIDCPRCESFKDKLKLLGLEQGKDWRVVDADSPALQKLWNEGFECIARDAQAALSWTNGIFPAVEIEGNYLTYSQAIKVIKKRLC